MNIKKEKENEVFSINSLSRDELSLLIETSQSLKKYITENNRIYNFIEKLNNAYNDFQKQ